MVEQLQMAGKKTKCADRHMSDNLEKMKLGLSFSFPSDLSRPGHSDPAFVFNISARGVSLLKRMYASLQCLSFNIESAE